MVMVILRMLQLPKSRGQSRLMRNVGGLVFEDVTLDAGLPENMNGLGGFVGDINNDTWPDFFFAHTHVMYINERDGTFRKLDSEFFDPQYAANARDGNLVWTCGAEIGDLNGDARRKPILELLAIKRLILR